MRKIVFSLLILSAFFQAFAHGSQGVELSSQTKHEQASPDTKQPQTEHKQQKPPARIIYKGVSKTPIYLCERGDMLGCFRAAEIYYSGSGVKRNVRTAVIYFKRSCLGGYGPACTSLGDLYRLEGGFNSRKKAIGLYEEGCKKNDGAACFVLGTYYKSGDMVKRNEAKSIKFLKRACELKYEKACER